MFFGREHENGENQKGGAEHFDEHPLSGVDALLQMGAIDACNRHYRARAGWNGRSLEAARTRREGENYCSGGDGPGELGDAKQRKPHEADATDKEQRQSDVWVKQPTGNAVKQPRGYQQTEPETHRSNEDVEHVRGRRPHAPCGRGRLDTSKSEREEDEGARKLE